jgi:hypothetical protein
MSTKITRADLQRVFGNEPKVIRFFEDLFVSNASNSEAAAAAGQATQAIQDASVVTLGPNAAFNNERVLTPGDGVELDTSNPAIVLIKLLNLIVLNGGFQCVFNLAADTNLDLPVAGRLMTDAVFAGLGNYANDAAASAGGVAVGSLYRNGSVLMVRVA